MNEQISNYIRKPLITLSTGGVIGAIGGATTMYFYSKHSTKRKVKALEVALKEFTEMDRAYTDAIEEAVNVTRELRELGVTVRSNLTRMSPSDHPEVVVEQIIQPTEEKLRSFNTTYEDESVILNLTDDVEANNDTLDEINGALVRRNIFDDTNDSWDYELERQNRTKETPYVIHADEFQTDEMGWDSQTTLTWYAGDEILTDSHDVPIYNPHTVVGELRFGHGSGDPNVVYVRNERLEAEYEVLRDMGSYEIIVLGGTSELEAQYEESDLRHSRIPNKFRTD